MTTLLTICILSYNRLKALALLIDSIDALTLPPDVCLLIKDDSGIQLCKNLESRYSQIQNISFSYNQKNLGYAASFLEALRTTESVYIMFVSDDDIIDRHDLNLLIAYLRSSDDSFISTKWRYKCKSSGRNINVSVNKKLKLTQVRQSSNHAPGLVWKRDDSIKFLGIIEERLSSSCKFVYFYPQVALLYMLILSNHKCSVLPLAPVNEGDMVGSSNLVCKSSGHNYFHPLEAVSENLCYNNFCREVLSGINSEKANALADLNEAKLFQDFAFALNLFSGAVYKSFVADAFVYIIKYRSPMIALDIIKLLLRRLSSKVMLLK